MSGRTTVKGTRPPTAKQHRLVHTNPFDLKRRFGPGFTIPSGKDCWTCSCATPDVWFVDSKGEAEERHREHVAAQNPEKPHPEDEVVHDEDGTTTVRYGFSSRGGQPAHRGEITYASKAEYDAAVESGLHDKHRLAHWYGALAANRGDQVAGEIVDENPHPENALAGVHPADDPANRVEAQPPAAPPERLVRTTLALGSQHSTVEESFDGGATWQPMDVASQVATVDEMLAALKGATDGAS